MPYVHHVHHEHTSIPFTIVVYHFFCFPLGCIGMPTQRWFPTPTFSSLLGSPCGNFLSQKTYQKKCHRKQIKQPTARPNVDIAMEPHCPQGVRPSATPEENLGWLKEHTCDHEEDKKYFPTHSCAVCFLRYPCTTVWRAPKMKFCNKNPLCCRSPAYPVVVQPRGGGDCGRILELERSRSSILGRF